MTGVRPTGAAGGVHDRGMGEAIMVATAEQGKALAERLAALKQANPEIADRFSLSKEGGSLGLVEGDTVYILYSTAIGCGPIIDCNTGGKYPTWPLADW